MTCCHSTFLRFISTEPYCPISPSMSTSRSVAALGVELDHTEWLPHSALKAEVPLDPQSAELPHNAELPHSAELPPTTSDPQSALEPETLLLPQSALLPHNALLPQSALLPHKALLPQIVLPHNAEVGAS